MIGGNAIGRETSLTGASQRAGRRQPPESSPRLLFENVTLTRTVRDTCVRNLDSYQILPPLPTGDMTFTQSATVGRGGRGEGLKSCDVPPLTPALSPAMRTK